MPQNHWRDLVKVKIQGAIHWALWSGDPKSVCFIRTTGACCKWFHEQIVKRHHWSQEPQLPPSPLALFPSPAPQNSLIKATITPTFPSLWSVHPLLHDPKAIVDPAEHPLSSEACSPLGSKGTPLSWYPFPLPIYSFSVSFADLIFLISKFWSARGFQFIGLSLLNLLSFPFFSIFIQCIGLNALLCWEFPNVCL